MPKSDNSVVLGPDTPIRTRLGVIVTLIASVAVIVGGAYSLHAWMKYQFQLQQEKLDNINYGQSNILYAVKRCWSIEDQQNWRDEEIELNPNHRLPRPNEIIRKRSIVGSQ